MKRNWRNNVLGLLMIGLMWLPLAAQQSVPVPLSHLVVGVSGEVRMKKASWGDDSEAWVPVTLGMELQSGDFIDAEFGQLLVACADAAVVTITDLTSLQCGSIPTTTDIDAFLKSLNINRDVPPTNPTPMLILPRGKTFVSQPRLTWVAIPNAASYQLDLILNGVSVFENAGLELPTTTTADYQLEIPLSDGRYSVRITALNSSGIRFASWESADVREAIVVEAMPPDLVVLVDQIRAESDLSADVPPWMADYWVALLFQKYEYHTDAIALLMQVQAQYAESLSASVYLKTARAYDALDLYDAALASYMQSIQVANANNDPYTAAEAHLYSSYIPSSLASRWCHWNIAYAFYQTKERPDSQLVAQLKLHGERIQRQLGANVPASCDVGS